MRICSLIRITIVWIMNRQTYLNHESCPSAHHKGIWGNGCITPLVLKLGIRLRSASWPGRFTPPGESPWYLLNRGLAGWVCLKTSLDALKRKIFYSCQGMNHGSSDMQPTDWLLPPSYPCIP